MKVGVVKNVENEPTLVGVPPASAEHLSKHSKLEISDGKPLILHLLESVNVYYSQVKIHT